MRLTRFGFALAAVATLGASQLSAQTMLVRQPSTYLGYGYGNSYWTEFTGIFNAAFGASNMPRGCTFWRKLLRPFVFQFTSSFVGIVASSFTLVT